METDLNTLIEKYTENTEEVEFQTEKEAEDKFISILQGMGYEYLRINNEKELENNLRNKIERLNTLINKGQEFKFTDDEWKRFFKEHISNNNLGIKEKTEIIQNHHQKFLEREGRNGKNVYFIDKDKTDNNYLQVINQYSEQKGNHNYRYDVTILVNGFPLVHIELKRAGVNIKKAFDQIDIYQKNSFWAGSGLFEYIQIFIISNTKDTKYYSNSTRNERVNENNKQGEESRASFEFTSYWSSKQHKKISNLKDFTKHFLNKTTILNILTKYCVFTTEKKLIVMRPYQIDAVESIINRIRKGIYEKSEGTKAAGGFIWHATGSGKTLTSFKAAQLASEIKDVEKVLFVVDRKSLDHQTVAEYQKYGGDLTTDAANTSILLSKLQDTKSKIIVTSINKLSRICKQNKDLEIFNKRVVLIFDECHRSQFGEMHNYITGAFKKYHIFGFTGTPIFTANSIDPDCKTTEHYFGEQLCSYTLVHAIEDRNVLKFNVSFFNVSGDKESRINTISDYIVENFNFKTKKKQCNIGFNSMLAADSIEDAIIYYEKIKEKLGKRDLKVATIFSPEEKHNEQLTKIMKEYNKTFEKDYDLTKFEAYRDNVSKFVKERKIDLIIVADMFLTGFDAPTLNTLWLDKPTIKNHKLIQAFSRTNRIYNEIKDSGIIVSFNDIEKQMNDALELFGYEDADRAFIIDSTFEEQYENYKKDIKDLIEKFPLDAVESTPEKKREFIVAWNDIEPQLNKLYSYPEFKNKEILSEEEQDEYRRKYLSYCEELKKCKGEKSGEQEKFEEPAETAIKFIKEVEVDINHILELIKNKAKDEVIRRRVESSPELRDKWPLISEYISNEKERWNEFIERKKLEEVKLVIEKYRLRNQDEIHRIIKEKNLEKISKGEWIEKVIEIMSFTDPNRSKTIENVRNELSNIVLKYWKIS